ncbi:unnamed protein product [Sphenostylis stenocarpa]|uniref:Cystatin domain-containing protein n=1 Tax=Sphenostylis stenocarpa TaxID=92480 RepID=A0AA86VD66_9FABA|nr:unnamed protein product [Sphenostylis stenocarpa]
MSDTNRQTLFKIKDKEKKKRVRFRMKLTCIFVTFVFFVCAIGRKDSSDGWNPIKNVDKPHVREIANFAIREFDRKSGQSLRFIQVIVGETKTVKGGTAYRLVVNATTDTPILNYYQTVVLENMKPKHFLKLVSFVLILD